MQKITKKKTNNITEVQENPKTPNVTQAPGPRFAVLSCDAVNGPTSISETAATSPFPRSAVIH